MKHRKFPAPQIAEAVFRGRKTPYNFEVYPLHIEFNEVPAVYVISRRKIDKYGRAHHAVVSMGQTDSLKTAVKTQRKVKTVKDHFANTVSVLLSEDEKARLAIEADLKAAYKERILRKPDVAALKLMRQSYATPRIEPKKEIPEIKIEQNDSAHAKSKKTTAKTEVSRAKKFEKAKAESLKPVKSKAKSAKVSQVKNVKSAKSNFKETPNAVKAKPKVKIAAKAKKPLVKVEPKKAQVIKKKTAKVSNPKTIKSFVQAKVATRSKKAGTAKINQPKAKPVVSKANSKAKAAKPVKKVQPVKRTSAKAKIAVKKTLKTAPVKKQIVKSKKAKATVKTSPKKVLKAQKVSKKTVNRPVKKTTVQKVSVSQKKAKAAVKKVVKPIKTAKSPKKISSVKTKAKSVSPKSAKQVKTVKATVKRQTRKR